MNEDLKYCQRCGSALAGAEVQGRTRPHCPSCGFVVFLDPKLAAAVLIAIDDRLLFVRRAIEPGLGRWSFPSGYVDRGESVEEAAVREVREETGLDVRLTGLVGLYSSKDSPVVLAVYEGEVTGDELMAGDEVQETGFFDYRELPPLAFPRDERIIREWLAAMSA